LEGSATPTTKVRLLSTESVHSKECCAETMGISADGSDVSADATMGLMTSFKSLADTQAMDRQYEGS